MALLSSIKNRFKGSRSGSRSDSKSSSTSSTSSKSSLPAQTESRESEQPNGSTNGHARKGSKDHKKKDWATLEDLIAQYGDSSNTTWTEDKFDVWRHPDNGVPIGYAISNDFCVIWGNPLCPKEQYAEVAKDFLAWVTEEQKLKPIWSCLDKEMETFLAKELDWRAVYCVQEDVVDPTKTDPEENKEVKRHIRGAEKAGCKIVAEDGVPSKEVQEEIDEVIDEWKKGRKGTQVHVTNVLPWMDTEHRRYFYARDADDKIVAFLFLAKVAQGWAIKDCLQLKTAPKNITEWLIATAIHELADDDENYLSFGPTPAPKLEPIDNLSNGRVKMLAALYGGIESTFLGNKREFRRKFKAEGEPIFVCFPEDGMGKSGADALMKVLTGGDD